MTWLLKDRRWDSESVLLDSLRVTPSCWCQPFRRPSPSKSPCDVWLQRSCSGLHSDIRLSTKLVTWANCTESGITGWCIVPTGTVRQPSGGSGEAARGQHQSWERRNHKKGQAVAHEVVVERESLSCHLETKGNGESFATWERKVISSCVLGRQTLEKLVVPSPVLYFE